MLLTLTVPSLVNPIDLLHIYMPMVMRGLKCHFFRASFLHLIKDTDLAYHYHGKLLCTDRSIQIGIYNTRQGLFWAITFLLLMLEIWTAYHFVCYDLQINLAHDLLVYYVCGKIDTLYNYSIGICLSDGPCMQLQFFLKRKHR